MAAHLRESDLEAYLNEALPSEGMARIEKSLRGDRPFAPTGHDPGATQRGVHSLGEVWRHQRLSCPTRQQLGSLLLDALPSDLADYVRFHLDVAGCRWCEANLIDLQNQQAESRGRPEPPPQVLPVQCRLFEK